MIEYVGIPEKPMFTGFPEWRPYQREAVRFVINTGNRFTAFNAPTGSGKSLVAMAIAKLLGKKVYYLASTKSLQTQLLKDFPEEVVVLKGRNNFNCLIKENTTCEKCMYQHVKEHCPLKSSCPYYVQKEIAKDSQVVVWNYSMFLTNQKFVKDFPKAELLICDEGHNVESELMNFVNIKFGYRFFHDINLPFPENDDREHILSVLNKASEIIGKKYVTAEGIIHKKIGSGEAPDIEEIQVCSKWGNQIKKLQFFGSVYNSDNWILDYFEDPRRWGSYISFKPIRVDNFSNYLFDWGNRILLMSATLPHLSILCSSLGISQESIKRLTIPSTFRKENRPVIFIPVDKMNRSSWKITLEKIISFLIVYCKHHKEKILIHCVSYQVADRVISASSLFEDYQIFYHKNAKERSDSLHDFKCADPPAILITPSMETGIDLMGDLCRVQFILKIPFLFLADKQIAERARIDHLWYVSCTIARLIQTSGRIVRSPTDWGTTYILDSCFEDLIKRHRRFFTSWFLESVYRVPTPYSNAANPTSEDWLTMLNGGKLEKM